MKKDSLLKDDLEEVRIAYFIDLYKNYNYINVYKLFNESNGLKKIALGRVLASKISEGHFLMDVNYIEEFLSSLDIDALWMIASSSKNDEIKELASEKVMAFLDGNIKCKKSCRKKRKL